MQTINRHVVYSIIALLLLALSACVLSSTNRDADDETPDLGAPDEVRPGDDDDAMPEDEESGSDSSLAGTSWKLISYGEPGAETEVIDDIDVTLQFQEGGQAVGSGGCNNFGTGYESVEDRLSFSEITATKMACTAEGVTEQEQTYFQALQSAGKFELGDDELTIWYSNDEGVLNFERM